MKHVTASLTIGACLLLSSAGMVLAADPHNALNPKGQPGTASMNGVSCSGFPTVPGGSGGANTHSPFGMNPPSYAGNPGNPTAQPGGVGNPAHSVSEYDVACFQQTVKQIP